MDQRELNNAVAGFTGEAPETIEALGFSLLLRRPPQIEADYRVSRRDLRNLAHQRAQKRLKSRRKPARKVHRAKPLVGTPSTGDNTPTHRTAA